MSATTPRLGKTGSMVSEATADMSEQPTPASNKPFSAQFTDKDSRTSAARSIYLKVMIGSSFAISLAIFGVFSIYWGSLWKTPVRQLHGWVVDFDGGEIGQAVLQGIQNIPAAATKVHWEVHPAGEFPNGAADVSAAVLEEHCWVAISINSGSSDALTSALANANASYAGSSAITVFAEEARNENAFRGFIRPSVDAALQTISKQYAIRFAQQLASASSSSVNLTSVLANAPQVITEPLSYTIANLRPFDVPVATAAVFVGLIYMTILAFFIVMTASAARQMSGLENMLTYGSLVRLFYSLLSMAFDLPFDRKFGNSGFLVFWMLNLFGMLALGLALESLITLLTPRFIPFFLLIWIITNVSVALFPLDVLPGIFRYGYAWPFYNISRAQRAIVFGTKNDVGLNFGVLIVWVTISCITLPFFQWLVRRSDIKAQKTKERLEEKVEEMP
ncbi:hypothetical protein PLEOSDRAFT_1097905 [Pleurotus ostreatus PC15]|uniref:DUF3533 domain-containing protein n=1 Tax=Pleurotus ostreatus (strain PC15) TaxID=1137138 RepID=A0A067NAK2_PLEO1|nr:hypothetical protein PLEOSDRAFT_1097905 [Pleurotus ostreatus PC15]